MLPEEKKPSDQNTAGDIENPEKNIPGKENTGFLNILKKAGFKIWLAVMIIGGTLAFIVALFLV